MEIDVGVEIKVDEVAGFRAFISATSGYGKSYLAARICEEFLEKGFLVAVVDPEGEYFTLRERYSMLVVGRDVPLVVEEAPLYARMILEKGVSAVLDFSAAELSDIEAQDFFARFGEEPFKLEGEYRRPLILVVEEAEVFAPQYARPASLLTCNKLAKRGRKRGIHTVWITQRSQDFSKMVLSQCNVFFIGRLTHERDLRAVEPYVGDVSMIPTLKPGEFLLVDGQRRLVFKTAKRRTPHGAETPFTPLAVKAPELSNLADELRRLLEKRRAEREKEQSEVERLKARIMELEKLLEEKEREIQRLKVVHDVVSMIPSIAEGDADIVGQLKALAEKVERLEKMHVPARDFKELRRQMRVKEIFYELSGFEYDLYSYIKEHPGCHKAKLLREFGVSDTKLENALSKLRRLHLIEVKHRSGRYHFYAREVGAGK